MRQARLQANLSLAEVARPLLTRQAVHLIETGKMRPSMRSLQHIANRLGKPVDAFLLPNGTHEAAELDERAAELGRLCLAHRYPEAVELAQDLLARGPQPRIEALARHHLGQALSQLKRPDEALDQLERARVLAESVGDPWLAAESLEWHATALHLRDDPSAVSVGEEALQRYRQLQPRRSETEARMLERLGTFLVRRGAHKRAQACYEEALEVAGTVQDLVRLARIYHGLSQCQWLLGHRRRATELASRAVALYAIESELRPVFGSTALARCENDLGMMQMHEGQLERAEEQFRAALEHFAAAGQERFQSHVLLSLGELRQMQGRTGEAFQLVEDAIELAEQLGEVVPLADGYQQLGQLSAEAGKPELAAANFEKALRTLEAAGLTERRQACAAAYRKLGVNGRPRRPAPQTA